MATLSRPDRRGPWYRHHRIGVHIWVPGTVEIVRDAAGRIQWSSMEDVAMYRERLEDLAAYWGAGFRPGEVRFPGTTTEHETKP